MNVTTINRATRTDLDPPPPFFATDVLTFQQCLEHVTEQPRVTRLAPFVEDELFPLDEPMEFESENPHSQS